ncbi:MAG: hypothetical protein A2469_03820 [Candidatus Magasanikbacteria bacterium RIFOXYC2_FULL_40_16]|uniref:BioF2-like acetyltransferase domain-containing protein n=2 Tax=Candidatus Magasanikiibacteriota TaxID=1752731 RepID=A0A1F6NEX0_9BACT|nr:MAG: hypothetical protein A2373_03085 [Candidatus Magasanikbacteria bacterium RIFOXYB1_FULL_40_15]OGH85124.1 MAG: hypothetical protein A2301_01805 [Candidatus Magasanikbacteria bacterium RIFOXYB2_FULL_40_13]OGH89369.1 MAG: hypothetical protein A2469_03820 [Candidatus Magasanikbacteria bacterium RIFOXYC2_FULL_40_16]
MKIQKCENRQDWDNYLNKQKNAEFLQSWEWGEFQEKAGARVIRLQIEENGVVFWQGQGFEQKLFLGIRFIYLPRFQVSGFRFQVSELFEYLKKQGYMFARIEPVGAMGDISMFDIVKVNNRQPKNTLVFDITKSEEELKEQMHQKTRYNIGLAERKGVAVKAEKNIDAFWRLNEETKARDKFKSHNKEYYKKMLDMEICHQLTAYNGNVPVASNICINFGGVFTYLHGASGNESRNLMAPYLLQWECIKFAKKIGAREYDFGGTAPLCFEQEIKSLGIKTPTCFNNFCWDVTHKWTGITRFKAGFGGAPKNYPDAVEVVFKKGMYKLFNKFKKIL